MADQTLGLLSRWRLVFFPKDAKGLSLIDRTIVHGFMGVKDAWVANPNVPEEKRLIDMASELAAQSHTTMPKMIIYKSPVPNAASLIGGSVIVGSNLMEVLNQDDMKAVIGHEISHHRHLYRDAPINLLPKAMVLAQPVVLWKAVKRFKADKSMGTLIATDAAAYGSTVLADHAWQRGCEFEADRESAELTQPKHMISALEKIEKRMNELRLEQVLSGGHAVRQRSKGWAGLLATHPQTIDRIARLKQMEAQDESTLSSSPISR